MRQLEKADTFGKEISANWQIDYDRLEEINAEVIRVSDVFTTDKELSSEEIIDAVCMALVNLGYMKFEKD